MTGKLLIAALFLCCIGCKENGDDISGSAEFSGKLYTQNSYDTDPKTLKKDHELFVLKDTSASATSFLFSTKSDKDGLFNFKFLYDQFYKIKGEWRTNTRLNNNILFTVETIAKPSKNLELILTPDTKTQNALFIICTDTTLVAGAIPGDSIYIYTSKLLAENDSATITGAGASYTFTAMLNGTAFKMNLPHTGKLYLNTACTFGNRRFKSKLDEVQLDRTGVDTLYIRLK